MRFIAATTATVLTALLFFSFTVNEVQASSVQVIEGGGGVDPLFEEHLFPLVSNTQGHLRKLPTRGGRLSLTRTLSWPECRGMTVEDCKNYIQHYITQRYDGHVIKNLQLLVRQPRSEALLGDNNYYYFHGVPSNLEVIGQSSCNPLSDGKTVGRDNEEGIWLYANGTKYVVPQLDCSGKTNAECCDLIWEHGEWMGLDKDGKHLTCYVYQEPTYPFFDTSDDHILKYPDYYTNLNGECQRKNYRAPSLNKQYKKVADKIATYVIEMIENLFEPKPFKGQCVDRTGKELLMTDENLIVLYRSSVNYPSRWDMSQGCLKRCIDYEIRTGTELTGCESRPYGYERCFGYTSEVFRGSAPISTNFPYQSRMNYNACIVDPVRSPNTLKCDNLKFVIDSFYNFARMPHLNGLMGQVQSEYYHEYCSEGEKEFSLSLGLKDLLMAIRDGAAFSGPVEVINFVYIVAGVNGIVEDTPRVASNNPALYPHLRHPFE